MSQKRIRIIAGGPYVVSRGVPLDEQVVVSRGGHRELEPGRTFETGPQYALCRCGASRNTPFCDVRHLNIGYKDGLEEQEARKKEG